MSNLAVVYLFRSLQRLMTDGRLREDQRSLGRSLRRRVGGGFTSLQHSQSSGPPHGASKEPP